MAWHPKGQKPQYVRKPIDYEPRYESLKQGEEKPLTFWQTVFGMTISIIIAKAIMHYLN